MKLRWLVTPLFLAGLGAVTWVTVRGGAGVQGTLGLLPPWVHVWALLVFCAELLCRGGRLAILARGVGRPLGLAGACLTQLVGEAAAAVTPSRSGSDPARLMVLRKLGVDLPGGGAMMVGEMVVEALALGVAVALLVVLVPGIGVPTAGISLYVLGSLSVAGATVALAMSIGRIALRLSFLPLLAAPFAPEAPLAPLLEWPLLLLYTMSVLPPPGGGGSVELGFSVGLASTLPAASLAGILSWWRIYTFYLGAILGGVIVTLSRVPLPVAQFPGFSWRRRPPGSGPSQPASGRTLPHPGPPAPPHPEPAARPAWPRFPGVLPPHPIPRCPGSGSPAVPLPKAHGDAPAGRTPPPPPPRPR